MPATLNQMVTEIETALRAPTISEILADLGVTHQRDENSTNDYAHSLFYAGRFIGRYDAHAVGELIREYGLEA